MADKKADLSNALRRAFNLGQTYWQQADSEYTSQHRKADETRAKFEALVAETIAASGVPASNISFEEAWKQMEARGFHYGKDALEQVQMGWELCLAMRSDVNRITGVARATAHLSEYEDAASTGNEGVTQAQINAGPHAGIGAVPSDYTHGVIASDTWRQKFERLLSEVVVAAAKGQSAVAARMALRAYVFGVKGLDDAQR